MKSCVGALDTWMTSHADLQELTQLKRSRPASCLGWQQVLASFLGSRCNGHCYYAHFLDKKISTERPRNFPKDTQLVNESQAHNPGHSHRRALRSGPIPPVPSLLLKQRPGYCWGKGSSEGEVTGAELSKMPLRQRPTSPRPVLLSGVATRRGVGIGAPLVQGQRHVS